MKGLALGLALKQRRKATQKSPIHQYIARGPFVLIIALILESLSDFFCFAGMLTFFSNYQ